MQYRQTLTTGPAGVLTRSAYYITQDLASVHLCRGGFEKSSPFLERTQNGRGLSQLHYSHCLYDCNFLWGHNTLYHPPTVPRPLWSSLHGLKPATGRNSMATWMPLIGLLNFHCNVYPGKIECHPWQWFGNIDVKNKVLLLIWNERRGSPSLVC